MPSREDGGAEIEGQPPDSRGWCIRFHPTRVPFCTSGPPERLESGNLF